MKPLTAESATKGVAALEALYGDTGPTLKKLAAFHLTVPSLRFQMGSAAPAIERTQEIEDAGVVHRYTGAASGVSLEFDPYEDDASTLRAHADQWDVYCVALSPELPEEVDDRGGLISEDYAVRGDAVECFVRTAEASVLLGARSILLKSAGAPPEGLVDPVRASKWLTESVDAIVAALPEGVHLLIAGDPSDGMMAAADVTTAVLLAGGYDGRARVLLHASDSPRDGGAAALTAQLSERGLLGGLTAWLPIVSLSNNDEDVFGALLALHGAGADMTSLRFVTGEAVITAAAPVLEAIEDVLAWQSLYARACLVDRDALRAAQKDGDEAKAEAVLRDAFSADVRPLLAKWRLDHGLEADPVAALRASGYLEKIARERAF